MDKGHRHPFHPPVSVRGKAVSFLLKNLQPGVRVGGRRPLSIGNRNDRVVGSVQDQDPFPEPADLFSDVKIPDGFKKAPAKQHAPQILGIRDRLPHREAAVPVVRNAQGGIKQDQAVDILFPLLRRQSGDHASLACAEQIDMPPVRAVPGHYLVQDRAQVLLFRKQRHFRGGKAADIARAPAAEGKADGPDAVLRKIFRRRLKIRFAAVIAVAEQDDGELPDAFRPVKNAVHRPVVMGNPDFFPAHGNLHSGNSGKAASGSRTVRAALSVFPVSYLS